MNETENKEEKLELVFGTENLLESAKEPFIGEVIYAKYPCHCEDCEKGAKALEKMFAAQGRAGETAPDRLHIHLKPLTVYTKVQSEWWIPTKTKLSKWGDLQKQLETVGLIDKFKTEREKAFMGLVAEWQWTPVKEVGVSNMERDVFHWLPVRILESQEVTELLDNLDAGKSMSPDEKAIQDEITEDATPGIATGEGTDASTKLD